VILAMGALHSPALLQRSGIGPAERLHAAGIAVIADLPGRRREPAQPSRRSTSPPIWQRRARQSAAQRAWSQNSLRYSSAQPGCPPGDMLMFAFARTGWHAAWPRGRIAERRGL
jgi:5-(hydroxymethyl)furfural/furfural oxidase